MAQLLLATGKLSLNRYLPNIQHTWLFIF